MFRRILLTCVLMFVGAFLVTLISDFLWSNDITWVENTVYALFMMVFTWISFGVGALIKKMDKKYENRYEERKRKRDSHGS